LTREDAGRWVARPGRPPPRSALGARPARRGDGGSASMAGRVRSPVPTVSAETGAELAEPQLHSSVAPPRCAARRTLLAHSTTACRTAQQLHARSRSTSSTWRPRRKARRRPARSRFGLLGDARAMPLAPTPSRGVHDHEVPTATRRVAHAVGVTPGLSSTTLATPEMRSREWTCRRWAPDDGEHRRGPCHQSVGASRHPRGGQISSSSSYRQADACALAGLVLCLVCLVLACCCGLVCGVCGHDGSRHVRRMIVGLGRRFHHALSSSPGPTPNRRPPVGVVAGITGWCGRSRTSRAPTARPDRLVRVRERDPARRARRALQKSARRTRPRPRRSGSRRLAGCAVSETRRPAPPARGVEREPRDPGAALRRRRGPGCLGNIPTTPTPSTPSALSNALRPLSAVHRIWPADAGTRDGR